MIIAITLIKLCFSSECVFCTLWLQAQIKLTLTQLQVKRLLPWHHFMSHKHKSYKQSTSMNHYSSRYSFTLDLLSESNKPKADGRFGRKWCQRKTTFSLEISKQKHNKTSAVKCVTKIASLHSACWTNDTT